MERQISLKDISNGKLCTLDNMVRTDYRDCGGCPACHRGMGSSIVLDSMDIYRPSAGLGQAFERILVSGSAGLNVMGEVMPSSLKISRDEERYRFLDEAGRCSIYPYCPGICRLFPLGRVYGDGSFRYLLQIHECKRDNRTRVEVRKRLDTPNAARYECYINDWHYHLKDFQTDIRATNDDGPTKAACMSILTLFHLMSYGTSDDFYPQPESRLEENRNNLQLFCKKALIFYVRRFYNGIQLISQLLAG